MVITISKTLYPSSTILKAAFSFTDKAYIHIEENEYNYLIRIDSKDENNTVIEDDFRNELLAQSTRNTIFEHTKDIRKLIIARALASTIISNDKDVIESNDSSEEDILMDWFDKHE